MRKSISHTQEFKVAPGDKAMWALRHPESNKSSEEAAAHLGIQTKGNKLKVLTNTGDLAYITVDVKFYNITPTAEYKKVWASLDSKKTGDYYYMIKGGNPKGKTSIWTTAELMNKSPEFIAFKKEITDAWDKYHNEHLEMLKGELVKSHAPAAKKAVAELPAIAAESGRAGVYEWFKKNKFELNDLKEAHMDGLVREIKSTGHVVSNWNISSRPDGYGHEEGVGVGVNWSAKVLSTFGWSSSD